MLDDSEAFGEQTLAYVRGDFAAQINLSLLWWRLGATSIHYEDLKNDAAGILASLAGILGSIPEARVKLALTLTSFSRMRDVNRPSLLHRSLGRMEIAPSGADRRRIQEPPSLPASIRGTRLLAELSRIHAIG